MWQFVYFITLFYNLYHAENSIRNWDLGIARDVWFSKQAHHAKVLWIHGLAIGPIQAMWDKCDRASYSFIAKKRLKGKGSPLPLKVVMSWLWC
jgi:hypothetical protein